MKTVIGALGLSLALAGCSSSAEAPTTPPSASIPATTSQRAMDIEVASVDLSHSERSDSGRESRTTPVGSSQMGIQIQALEGHLAQQQMAELALERVSDPMVKEAARSIETEHETAETGLRQAAGSVLPDTMNLSREHQSVMTRLRGLSGPEFDVAYVGAMVSDHEKALGFYEKQAREAPTEELRAYFSATSEVLAKHLEHCKQLQAI